ncbi:hypothetical protein THUN1379_32710 [Paludibacterium sp. THUN1379]|uniref:calcium-binding protein n=1 Tax=Paludibacterium sp. THUN1379 TaxID=3112107 RepID=UPI003084EF03|nr:hypothetical protein THUN1379_32710 [Paludibacterium sp. THUN1379]
MQKHNVWSSTTSAVQVEDGTTLLVPPLFIDGSDQDDVMQGGRYGEIMDGAAGNDRIDGSDGHDSLEGRDGNDVLLGGRGDDRIAGGAGEDLMTGGEGRDEFFWHREELGGTDTITDFELGIDHLYLPQGMDTVLVAGTEGTALQLFDAGDSTLQQTILLQGVSWSPEAQSQAEMLERLLMPV